MQPMPPPGLQDRILLGIAAAAAIIVALLWGPYMKKVLPGIVAEIERQVECESRDGEHRRAMKQR